MSGLREMMDFEEEQAYYQGHGQIQGTLQQTYTTKIPPSYNGKTSWFAFEDAVLDWIDITELDEVKQDQPLRMDYGTKPQHTNHFWKEIN